MTADSSFCSIGIDLGTSNCSLSYIQDSHLDIFAIPQKWDDTKDIAEPLLPSFILLEENGEPIPGLWAKEQSVHNMDHVIWASKSWLCHSYVDRRKPILPWGISPEKGLSPVRCGEVFLSHMMKAFLKEKDYPQVSQIVVTIPASFDEEARKLTLEACEAADIKNPVLLEEPLAALYGWLEAQGESWREHLSLGDKILVCDVGGGTTDLSLFSVTEDNEGLLQLERILVGPHILLGGDNMDLALAYHLKGDKNLDSWQMQNLIHQSRMAKETLYGDDQRSSYAFSVASKSSKLFGKSLAFELSRESLDQVVGDGFFPIHGLETDFFQDEPESLEEFGLPYAKDPRITAHLLSFLKETQVFPTKVLFNGGPFKAQSLRQKILDSLIAQKKENATAQTKSAAVPTELPKAQLDLGVCKGAAYYGKLLHSQEGVRVKAGAPRAYYIGVAPKVMAVPGQPKTPLSGLCILPLGTQEGSILSYKNRPFFLHLGSKTTFFLFSSRLRTEDQLGDMVPDGFQNLDFVTSLEVNETQKGKENQTKTPVFLTAHYTHVGTLALSLEDMEQRSWALEFELRQKPVPT